MPISWNEIRHNAIKFSKEWCGATSESSDKQTFWNEFFTVFGIPRKTVATFEVPVLKTSGNFGKIDLLWKNMLLVEHKSQGEDLDKAKTQAFDYIQAMLAEGRGNQTPRYVIVSDFARVVLHDLEPEEQNDLPLFRGHRIATHEFPLAEFQRHIHHFAFVPGYKQHTFQEQDPANIEAAEIMGELHDKLEAGGYTGHDLEQFLVRVLFCLFAEDTGIFERESFHLSIENRTAPDGSDLGQCLARLFEILNTPPEKRQKNLDETLTAFPYVNGDLFNEHLGFADFNRDMRQAILDCTIKDWSRISPAIFGSLFQSIMESKERRQIGAHYTSERDILKVVRSLFLDDLRAEFEKIIGRSPRPVGRGEGNISPATGARRARLEEFHKKLCQLRFLDPACGCGNFLVITYRELRQLELELLKELYGQQAELTLDDINKLSQVNVDQFYGIEIGEWPARIAEVALWLMDHQMNLKVSEAFGQLYQRLPLKKSPHIVQGNALRKDWKEVLPPEKCSYILGNPPFVGKQYMTDEQDADMKLVCGDVKGHGLLDFVTAWYFKAAEYIKDTKVVVGFVSTNSLTQGEQVGILWNALFQHGIKIHFGHRTFAWESEARGKAHVHVVILGFAISEAMNKRIYDYEGDKVTMISAKNISPYLVEGSDKVVTKRSTPICNVPEIVFGSMPNDGGNLLLSNDEKKELLTKEPNAAEFVRPFLGSEEFIHGISRWCLWLSDISPQDLRAMPEVLKRVEAVREQRLKSSRETTRELANSPTLFGEIRQPTKRYLAVPEVSSERRAYIPIGFLSPRIVASNKLYTISGADNFIFGVLSSAMHMAWVRQVTGRLKSDFQYSGKVVYNNYPWPLNVSEKQRAAVEEKAQAVLDARAEFPDATLADLYDPVAMPPRLHQAHEHLNRAVDLCYRKDPFASDRHRVEYLFSLYEQLTAPLLPVTKKRKRV